MAGSSFKTEGYHQNIRKLTALIEFVMPIYNELSWNVYMKTNKLKIHTIGVSTLKKKKKNHITINKVTAVAG